MSGRIRTIKPEWLEDDLVLASAHARVLSIALLLLADDYGNGRANVEVLRARVFPMEPERFLPALEELVERRFVTLYQVNGQRYFSVRNWRKHQRVDKPGKPLVPGPEQQAQASPEATRVAYFIKSEATGLIKIGESVDPIRRLAELSLQAPEALHLLAVGGTEGVLHAEFAADRVHGEWFRESSRIVARIRELGGSMERPMASAGYDGKNRSIIAAQESSLDLSRDPPEDSRTFAGPSRLTWTTTTTNDQEGRGSGGGCAVAPSPAAPPPPALELVADEPKPAAKPKRAASPESAERAALRAATSDLAASFGHDVAPTASRVHLAAGAAKVSGLVSRGVGLREAAERVARAAYERLQGGRSTSYGYALQDCVLGPSAGPQGPYRGGSSRCATAEELGPPTRLEDIYVLGPEDLELIGAMQ